MKRRDFIQAGLAAGASVALSPAIATPMINPLEQVLVGKGAKQRVVILGGGWGGLATARHLQIHAPQLEVLLLERNPVFWSCPMSNKWLVDLIDGEQLIHSYTAAAKKFGYTYIQTEVTQIDRDKRRVHTARGYVEFDWLVVSAGIRVSYEPWLGDDKQAIQHTVANYASAYIPSTELIALKQKIKQFKGGNFVMTLPPPPHRCPPSPYERACLIASYFQKNRIPGKIIILDPKPRIAPITIGYRTAFEELYKDTIVHVPNAGVTSLDPYKKEIKTKAGDFSFDDAILMGHHQAADLTWKLDAIGKTPEGKPNNWASVHPEFYNLKDDPRIYIIGDSVGAVSPQFGHYPKSGHVAQRMGRSVAQYISEQAKNKTPSPILIDNLCYMLVNTVPKESISVQFDYKMGAEGHLLQTQIDDNERRAELWEEDKRWYNLMMTDFTATT